MGDDKALLQRIQELEQALENAEKRAVRVSGDEELEIQLADTEQALEIALRARANLEQQNDELRQIISDTELKYTSNILEKDVEIVNLQLELQSLSEVHQRLNEKDRTIEQQCDEIIEYKASLQSLREWCIEKAKTSAVSEARLEQQAHHIQLLGVQIGELQRALEEERCTIASYKELSDLNETLLSECSIYEKCLESQLDDLKNSGNSYKDAFEKLGRVFTEKEVQAASEVQKLTARVAELQETVDQNAVFLAPRWKKKDNDRQPKGVASLAALTLMSRNEFIDATMLRAENQFLSVCVTPDVWAVEVHIHTIAVALLRVTFKADAFIDYIFNAHYEDLVLDAQNNPLSVVKDRSFIRWLHDAVCHLTRLLSEVAQLFEAFRRLTLDQMITVMAVETIKDTSAPKDRDSNVDIREKWVTATSPLMTLLERGERDLNALLEATQNDYLSAAFDISVFETFLSDIQAHIKQMVTRGLSMESISSIYRDQDSTSEEYGILPPVLNATARRLASVAVVGLCGASYTKHVAKALPAEVWIGLWDASKFLSEWIPFGHVSNASGASPVLESSVLAVGYGLLKLPRRGGSRTSVHEFLSTLLQALDVLVSEVCSVKESDVSDVTRRLQKEILVVGNALEKMNAMCKNFVPPRQGSFVAPWVEAVERVLRRIFNVTAVQRDLTQIKASLRSAEEKVQALSGEALAAKEALAEWQQKYSVAQLQLERASLYEPELQERRATETRYAQLLAAQQQSLRDLESQALQIRQENADLNAKVKEATQILEVTKRLPVQHQHQSEWENVEVANLKAINRKLERELYALQMDGVERDLHASDLDMLLPRLQFTKTFGRRYKQEPAVEGVSSTSLVPQSRCSHDGLTDVLKNLLQEHQSIQRAVMRHLLNPPVITLTATEKERRDQLSSYANNRASLALRLGTLKDKIECCFGRLLQSSRSAGEFGAVSKAALPEWQFLDGLAQRLHQHPKEPPAVRIVMPHPPSWSPCVDMSLCKLAATSTQLRELERRFLTRTY